MSAREPKMSGKAQKFLIITADSNEGSMGGYPLILLLVWQQQRSLFIKDTFLWHATHLTIFYIRTVNIKLDLRHCLSILIHILQLCLTNTPQLRLEKPRRLTSSGILRFLPKFHVQIKDGQFRLRSHAWSQIDGIWWISVKIHEISVEIAKFLVKWKRGVVLLEFSANHFWWSNFIVL